MRRLLNAAPIASLALILPIAALADVKGTQTLTANQTLSLDTGTVVTSGGDILWTGGSIVPQGSATALTLAGFQIAGTSEFNSLSQIGASAISGYMGYSSAAISASSLPFNAIFAVHTNGGNYALVLVTQTGSAITLQFVTFGVSTVPTITQVLNNYGLTPAGFGNSGIAPGTLFIIKGTGLASATSVSSLQSTTGGSTLPTSLNGATVKVTVGGFFVAPAFYYAENVQLALVLPSNTPVGAGTVTVTYNGQTSAPFNIQVVTSAFGFAAYYGAGTGLAHVQDLNYGYYSYTNSIPPGATVRLIGSGLGADPTRDTQYVQPTAASAISALAHVYVGGIDAPIFYQGPEGYPGVDEVDVTIPLNGVATGCNVSVVGVSTAGVPTNFLSLPIGVGACSDPAFGTSGSTISSLSGQSTVNTGVVFLDQSSEPANGGGTTTNDIALAEFQSYTGATYGTATGTVSIGGCVVSQSLGGTATTTGTTTGLDAGTITVSGPNGNATLTSEASILPGDYIAQLATGFIPASGGVFTVSGSGGKDVGAFTTQITYPNPVLTWTNQGADATITRSSGAVITWSGGEAGTFVIIAGNTLAGSASASFTCLAPVGPGQFTVPGYVLLALPAGSGSLAVANYTNYGSFTATGLDSGHALGFVSYGIKPTYQ